MRINLPVTGQEREYSEQDMLVVVGAPRPQAVAQG